MSLFCRTKEKGRKKKKERERKKERKKEKERERRLSVMTIWNERRSLASYVCIRKTQYP